jgi:6-phosphogluconolactonase
MPRIAGTIAWRFSAAMPAPACSSLLQPIGHVAVPASPRHFALSPDARWLLSAGQASGRVAVFAVESATGALRPTPHECRPPEPVCVCF